MLSSGVAGVILAISCCAAVKKLCAGRNSSSLLPVSIEDALVELMTLSHNLVSVGKFHQLASDAGFEEDFLLHFGRNIFPCSNMEDLEFWIGLVQNKLSAAFHRESVIIDKKIFHDKVAHFVSWDLTFWLFEYLENHRILADICLCNNIHLVLSTCSAFLLNILHVLGYIN